MKKMNFPGRKDLEKIKPGTAESASAFFSSSEQKIRVGLFWKHGERNFTFANKFMTITFIRGGRREQE